jgi:hypothetical protein
MEQRNWIGNPGEQEEKHIAHDKRGNVYTLRIDVGFGTFILGVGFLAGFYGLGNGVLNLISQYLR